MLIILSVFVSKLQAEKTHVCEKKIYSREGENSTDWWENEKDLNVIFNYLKYLNHAYLLNLNTWIHKDYYFQFSIFKKFSNYNPFFNTFLKNHKILPIWNNSPKSIRRNSQLFNQEIDYNYQCFLQFLIEPVI